MTIFDRHLRERLRTFLEPAQVDQMIGEGDRVASLWRIHLRHTGTFQGLQPTNRSVDFNSFWMHRIVDNKVVEVWFVDEEFVSKLR